MGERLSTGFAILLLVLLAALTYWLDQMMLAPAALRDKPVVHEPDYVVQRLLATRMNLDGRVRDTLQAEKLMHYPDDDSTDLSLPRFVSYVQGTPLSVTSKTARMTSNGGNLYFEGDVLASRAPGEGKSELRVSTQYLHVLPDDNIARTDRAVEISDSNLLMKAGGMELNSDTRVLKLTGGVQGFYHRGAAEEAASNRR